MSKELILNQLQSFNEDVSDLEIGSYMRKSDDIYIKGFPDIVIVNFNVLFPFMKYKVKYNLNGVGVVNKERQHAAAKSQVLQMASTAKQVQNMQRTWNNIQLLWRTWKLSFFLHVQKIKTSPR